MVDSISGRRFLALPQPPHRSRTGIKPLICNKMQQIRVVGSIMVDSRGLGYVEINRYELLTVILLFVVMRLRGKEVSVFFFLNNKRSEKEQTLAEDVGGSKRRCIRQPRDFRNSNVVLNLNAGGQCLPLNRNVNISDHQTLAEDVGGSKQICTRQLDSACPSQAMRDRQCFEVSSDMNVDVPDLQRSLGAQQPTTNDSFSVSDSVSHSHVSLLGAQGSTGEHCFGMKNVLKALARIDDQCVVVVVREDVLRYMFNMASLGAHVDEYLNNGRGPYVFKIFGQLYHWLGSLCPVKGEPPRVLQLYIYDTDNEVDNPMSHFGGQNSDLCRDIVEGLIDILDTHNALVHLFRTAREKLANTHIPNFKVRLYNVVGTREYELPTGDMLGAIVYEPGLETDMDYDIVIEERFEHPQRVNKLHSSYMSLQFLLLFLYKEDGCSKELKLVGGTGIPNVDKRLTMKAYYVYFIHDCANCYNYLSRTRRLFQLYVVIAFCAIEQNRTDFVREHQNNIRNEYLSGIYDAINRGDNDGSDSGARLILPQSFTGGPRYMCNHYLDALSICSVHGNPSFFITFTCNVKWPEITEFMAEFQLLIQQIELT
nr:DNA helicase [Tanacetum cinerariifolium]